MVFLAVFSKEEKFSVCDTVIWRESKRNYNKPQFIHEDTNPEQLFIQVLTLR